MKRLKNILRRIRYKFGRGWYKLGCVIKSTLSLFMYRRESFLAHYNGPAMKDSIEDFFDYLKWEYKADRQIDPWEAREKLAELLDDRGVSW